MRNTTIQRSAAGLALLVTTAIIASGCAPKPTSVDASASTADFSSCLLADTGGINDRSVNAAAWAGLQAAEATGVTSADYVQAKTEADYTINLQNLVRRQCDSIVTVGGLLTEATATAAASDPDGFFIQIDAEGAAENWRGLTFDTAQSGFLSGYLAAGYSKSGVVATFGGIQIVPVTAYLDGFARGVRYYNSQNGASVRVLGWDDQAQQGSFTGSFSDQSAGQRLTNNFIQEGADVIFPVAGGAGLGAAAAAQAANGPVVIWVDSDGFESASQYAGVFLSSALKRVDLAVQDAVEQVASGNRSAEDYVGTLANKGVGLAPFHDLDSSVSDDLKAQLDAVTQGIIDGSINVSDKAQP